MDTIQIAHKILRDAEAALRELIQSALEKQQYSDIAKVAQIADAVSKILSMEDLTKWPEPVATSVKSSQPRLVRKRERPKPKSASAIQKEYPKFIRDGERLVKVGWSKKNRKEYEHRVPFAAVMCFARYLVESIAPDTLFQIDDFLPVIDSEKQEIPSYQIYVTLAWLISMGAVEKKGRDGYFIVAGRLSIEIVNKLWARLSETDHLKKGEER